MILQDIYQTYRLLGKAQEERHLWQLCIGLLQSSAPGGLPLLEGAQQGRASRAKHFGPKSQESVCDLISKSRAACF